MKKMEFRGRHLYHVKYSVRFVGSKEFYIIVWKSGRNQGTTENRHSGHCTHTSGTTKHSVW